MLDINLIADCFNSIHAMINTDSIRYFLCNKNMQIFDDLGLFTMRISESLRTTLHDFNLSFGVSKSLVQPTRLTHKRESRENDQFVVKVFESLISQVDIVVRQCR